MEIPTCTLSSVQKQNSTQLQPQPLEQIDNFYSIYPTETEQNIPDSPKKSKYHLNIELDYFYNFKPILEELIEKKTQNIVWQTRYFVLTPTRLLYYTSSYKNQLKGCFNFISLAKYSPQLKEEDGILTLIVIIPTLGQSDQNKQESKEILKLNFQENHQTLLKWKNNLMTIIAQSSSHQPKLYPKISLHQLVSNKTDYPSGNYYWNKIFISPKEFRSYGNHMDIVFFRSRSTGSAFSRLMMRSHFDHVGLLFKDQLDRLFVLEAIQSRGVWVTEWKTQLQFLQQTYEQIAYKKLILPLGRSLDYEKLQIYLNKVIGKKYQLSFEKLLIPGDEETQNNNTIIESSKLDHKSVRYIANRESSMNSQNIIQNSQRVSIKEEIDKKCEEIQGKECEKQKCENINIKNQNKSLHKSQIIVGSKNLYPPNELEKKAPSEFDKNQSGKQLTFFCSELIADIYIKFGLIKGKKKHQFWPMDFQNNLKLQGGAQLSPLMQIQF